MSAEAILRKLQLHQIVCSLFGDGKKYGAGWWYAKVDALPPDDATGEHSQSVYLRWLDEVGGEGSGIYGFDQTFDKPQWIAAAKIVNTCPDIHPMAAKDGQERWLTAEALAAHAADYTPSFAAVASSAAAASSSSADTSSAAAASSSAVASSSSDAYASSSAVGASSSSATAASSSSAAAASSATANAIPVPVPPLGWAALLAAASPSTPQEINLEELELRESGRKKLRIGSSALLSLDPCEWLNDCQVANLIELLELRGCKVMFRYPRPATLLGAGSVTTDLFTCRRMRKVLTGDSSLVAIGQNYIDQGHWYTLIVLPPERLVLYAEPFGTKARPSVLKDFDAHVKALDIEWRLESLEVKLQTDGHSCGVWTLVLDRALVAYLAQRSNGAGGSGGFAAFFTRWLGAQGVTDLHTVCGSAAHRQAARSRNATFISEARNQMRAQLLQAARTGQLRWQSGPLIDIFVEGSGSAGASALELEELDGEDDT